MQSSVDPSISSQLPHHRCEINRCDKPSDSMRSEKRCMRSRNSGPFGICLGSRSFDWATLGPSKAVGAQVQVNTRFSCNIYNLRYFSS